MVVHITGSEKVVADFLSRMFELSDPPADQLAVRLLQSISDSFDTFERPSNEGSFLPRSVSTYSTYSVRGQITPEVATKSDLVVFCPQRAKRPRCATLDDAAVFS
jgi:hypothetical protein